MIKLHLLGTGCALATKCYNTCFSLQSGEEHFLVDGGGGNGILVQLEKAGIELNKIRNVFVTHAHTDHLLGVIWVLRFCAMGMLRGGYDGDLTVYCHRELADTISLVCGLTLPPSHYRLFGRRIFLHRLEDGETCDVSNLRLTFFDIMASKDRQFGFKALLPDGQSLVCLGDEPYHDKLRAQVEYCDWLLAEAFCLYAERERFRPYDKGHSTARDAGARAEELGVKNLLLYHTEDGNLAGRKALYSAEAAEVFSGRTFVPDDLEVIVLDSGRGGDEAPGPKIFEPGVLR